MPHEIPDALLKGRRLGRRPTKAEIEAACEALRKLPPGEQKCVVWLIRKMAEAHPTGGATSSPPANVVSRMASAALPVAPVVGMH